MIEVKGYKCEICGTTFGFIGDKDEESAYLNCKKCEEECRIKQQQSSCQHDWYNPKDTNRIRVCKKCGKRESIETGWNSSLSYFENMHG
jgi:DNA-directed RNA polymerase subunit RPC12/RpoP